MKIPVIVPRALPTSTQRRIAPFVKLVADCHVTQAAACDEIVTALRASGNLHEAFAFETAAEQFRDGARINFEAALTLATGIAHEV